jgi:hypothetical protein
MGDRGRGPAELPASRRWVPTLRGGGWAPTPLLLHPLVMVRVRVRVTRMGLGLGLGLPYR